MTKAATLDDAESDKKPKTLVGSLVHGLNIIQAFDRIDPEMTLTQVAEKTGMDRAGARRYLLTLAELGFVEQTGRLFRLMPKVMDLGYSYLASIPLNEKAQFYLNRIRDKTGYPVALAIRDHQHVIHLAAANTDAFDSPALSVGRRFGLTFSSSGRCILAMSDPEVRDAVLAGMTLTPQNERSLKTMEALKAELGRIAEQGYAIVDQEMQTGIRSLAVPVFDKEGAVQGCFATYTYVGVKTMEDVMSTVFPEMSQAAKDISRALI
ncbi:IclR family transcriptional regulator domain-containing protein [Mesobacterium pallidum]|uniref:IclR family transcriptional regulator domain-containing protein n=1 Tax=Mesobacterium pallidum TaxID=2872037 RepID=UPI001EE3430B|nr:IclR family transcriptional regulator C-terminal domain-containing protein [Mesobacterium pallidum]